MTSILRRAGIGVILAGALSVLSACTTLPSADSPQEYLDPTTAATISVVGEPLVFAHERPERAAHMRDYVTLAAAAVNRGGKTNYTLIAYYWTTLDEHGRLGDPPASSDALIIVADDRRIALSLAGHSAHDAGIGTPVHAPPAKSAVPNVYRTDLATMRFIAAARHLVLFKNADDPSAGYELWDDKRAALEALVRLLSGEK
ncbi:MAG: hypothetical protein JWN85_3853 [Gammaproteobacteria bacterium]|nr:hypothetical protein [Gammaproteobacteria bacterium]